MAKNGIVSGLQICYYDGERIENEPENCIHVPFNSIVDYFIKTKNRFPSLINSDNTNLSTTELSELQDEFKKSMNKVQNILDNKIINIKKEIQKLKPNFNDEKLRIFAYGCRETVLIKHLVKNILIAADELGYETYLHTQDNDMESCNEVFYLKALRDFNPHITINVNHLNNDFISDEVFNFIWFQDYMPLLRKESPPIHLRDRDLIYHLTNDLKEIIFNKGIYSEFQSFCMNEKIYKPRPEILKEKKIVFIGSSYKDRINDIKLDPDFQLVFNEAKDIFEKKSCLTNLTHPKSDLLFLMQKYSKSLDYVNGINAYLIRDYCVEKLCSINTNYEIEIYGWGWNENKKIQPYYKGIVENGESISKIYNSATYGFCPGSYILMQRTLECAFSETVPLVLDVREDKQEEYNNKIEESLEFFHIGDLENILNSDSEVKKTFAYIKEQYSYKKIINNFMASVNRVINEK
ncbi:hypothetical protein FJR48_00845 [Sulfurimonas lithotrophica]|uniref:Glycosyltransferase family 1 protein n=1 Tax=Sulfurimonas lithotrophica TaxID=2590022 RepID=A0A5P8NY42_9BACT|nr:hypothetical protein [Sulfurimonas lithotrophica]QFR48348.1 hypothetical protein FJR48_00845 [Sulfurimonas lithotrophica]